MSQKKTQEVLITGGGVGIGAAISRAFLSKGFKVYIFSPNNAKLEVEPSSRLQVINVDFRCPETIQGAFIRLKKYTKNIDVLVNNSGVFPRTVLQDIELDEWTEVLNINLTSYFLCSKYTLDFMKHDKKYYIVNISSDAAYIGPKKGVHYAASKAGVVGLTKSLSNSLAERNINVNVVIPGITDTQQSRLKDNLKRRIRKEKEIPLRRVADPEDVSKVVVSLCSEEFSYVTGQKIFVDGGRNSI